MTYEEAALLPKSEKITLVVARAVERVKLFTIHSGSVYYKDVDYFVESVKDGATLLTEHTNTTLSAGQWYFNPLLKRLYVRVPDSSNPKTRDLSLTYKMFFSNAPINLPHDLASGQDVEWLPVINSVGSIGQQLDEESTGIVLESSSSIDLINNDGYFDEIFDTLIWENQAVDFYSYITGIPLSEKRKIFEGVIEAKDFSSDKVIFKVKDFVFKLRDVVDLGVFTLSDGTIDPSLIDKPKRRIYGQVKQIDCAGVSKTLNGYDLTGTITGTVGTNQITGTDFLSQISPSDELYVVTNEEEVKISIQSIESATAATLGDELETTFTAKTGFKVRPAIPYHQKNRTWHIAGHKLRAPTATITQIISDNRFLVDTSLDMYANDQIEINGDLVSIRRISGNEIVLKNSVSPTPSVSDVIYKLPVQKVFVGSTEYIYSRDWTFTNTTEAKIVFNDLAEFNVANARSLGVDLTFTNASRTLTTASVADFRSILKSRDWIRSGSITEPDYYEILEVKEQTIILRAPFTGLTATKSAIVKSLNYIDDSALVTCNCLGIEVDGLWVKTPSDTVRHLVLSDANFATVDEDAFTKARADCDYILSLPIPESIGGSAPSVRDVITKINESVFGSLYGNSSFAISYSILNARKPADADILGDDDILGFDVKSGQRIINNVKVNYRPYIDIYSGQPALETYSKTSEFVDNLIGIKNTHERTLYIYEDDKAEIIAQRILLFNSMASSIVTIKSKMNLALTSVNDKIFLSLDRLYKRYGGKDKRKIGTVTGVKKNGLDTEITLTDLGNVYNRVPAICPDTTADYSAQVSDDLIRWGYVLDNDTLTPDVTSEVGLGNNIIG